MKKIIFIIVMLLLASSLQAGPKVNLGPKESLKKISITYQKQDVPLKENINPLMFCMAFCERLAYGLELYKYISFEDIVKTGKSIYSIINNGCAGKLTIAGFKDGSDLVFDFYFTEKGGQRMLMCVSNYVEASKEIAGEDRKGECWAMAYYLIGNKLVDYSYVTGGDKTPKHGINNLSLANYYMQDSDADNDRKIEPLILNELKRNVKMRSPVTYAILSQYYMMANNPAKAGWALGMVMASPKPEKGVPRDDLYYITAMELAIAKECYAMTADNK